MAVALITGAARRIGRTIALNLARNDFSVIIHYHNSREEADALNNEITKLGKKSYVIQANLADQNDCDTLIDNAIELAGSPIDLLINNASLYEPDTVFETNYSLFKAHHDINLFAPLCLSAHLRAALPNDRDANIINIIDQRVLNPSADFASYLLSKSSLWTLTKLLAAEYAPTIRVNAISPGPVLQSKHQTEADFRREELSVPLKRGPSPEEIAEAVMFIVKTPSMTGQMLTIDGGQHLKSN